MKQKNIFSIFIISIILLSIFLSGCTRQKLIKPNTKMLLDSEDINADLDFVLYSCQSYKEKCTSYEDTLEDICSSIKDPDKKNLCLGDCEKISDQDDMGFCYGSIYRTDNSCDNIKDPDKKNLCLALLHKNKDHCQNIDSEYRFICMVKIDKDPNNCLSITSPDLKNQCFAYSNNDISYCEKIKDKEQKAFCSSYLKFSPYYCYTNNCEREAYTNAALASLDTNYCNNIEDNTQKNICIQRTRLNTALEKKDPMICNKITLEDMKQDCKDRTLYSLAVERLNHEYCGEISEGETKKNCILETDYKISAKAVEEVKKEIYCENIQDNEITAMCKNIINKDIKACQRLRKKENQLICIHYLSLKDRSLCLGLEDPLKQECLDFSKDEVIEKELN